MAESKPLKHRRLMFESLESRELMAMDFAGFYGATNLQTYSVDGTGNNATQIKWGSNNEQLLRLVKAQYGDSISTPSGSNRPSARAISNAIADQGTQDIISDRNLSAFTYAWGQFIDHDIGLTPTGTSERMSIPVPTGDPYFDPNATGTKTINTNRSVFSATTGTTTVNPRQQINTITAWMDGSMVYGSDQKTADALRTFQMGKLKMDASGMLPINNATNFPSGTVALANDSHLVPDNQLYAAGDVRANENVELTSLHTLFVREHNRWAIRIAAANPNLSDTQIYQRARSVVIGEIQAITYNEWLPTILGPNAMPRYLGYDPRINPDLSNEFSTAAFRFGHSLLGDDIQFLDSNGRPTQSKIPLSNAFFNPTIFKTATVEQLYKYLASDPASELDAKVVGSIRNFLFGPPGAGGFDLASLNIQRGRDHGIGDYNSVRSAIGLPKVRSFAEITRNQEIQAKLKSLYGSVDNIDLWVGILVEDHVPGASVGPTASRIISEQFNRIRGGDRFWYQNQFTGQLLQEIHSTKLSDVISRNSTLKNLQANVFVFDSSIEGTVFADTNRDGRRTPNETALAGWTVSLIGSDSAIVSTVVTGRDGRYRFQVQNGLRTDTYSIRITKDSAGSVITSSPTIRATIQRGDQFITNADLGFSQAARAIPTPPPMANVASIDQFFSDLGTSSRRRTR